MWLIAGLGNPGTHYASHRHNVGFQFIDALAQGYHFPSFGRKLNNEASEGRIGDEKVILAKPQSFMNLSGPPIASLAHFFKIPLTQILVVHDEMALNPGKIKIKQGGGSAGHNGLKSLMATLGPDFMRLRIGIGHPGDPTLVTPYVLSAFISSEKKWLSILFEKMTQELPLILSGQSEMFVSRVMQP